MPTFCSMVWPYDLLMVMQQGRRAGNWYCCSLNGSLVLEFTESILSMNSCSSPHTPVSISMCSTVSYTAQILSIVQMHKPSRVLRFCNSMATAPTFSLSSWGGMPVGFKLFRNLMLHRRSFSWSRKMVLSAHRDTWSSLSWCRSIQLLRMREKLLFWW